MNSFDILRETVNRLYVIRETKTPNSPKTREEDWLESLVRVLLGYHAEDNIEIPVDLEILHSKQDLVHALIDRIEGL